MEVFRNLQEKALDEGDQFTEQIYRLIHDNDTRWNSLFAIIDQAVKLRGAIDDYIFREATKWIEYCTKCARLITTLSPASMDIPLTDAGGDRAGFESFGVFMEATGERTRRRPYWMTLTSMKFAAKWATSCEIMPSRTTKPPRPTSDSFLRACNNGRYLPVVSAIRVISRI
jgi:hypothetical protein